MRRGPPRSTRPATLFPYTTLFRSRCPSERLTAGNMDVRPPAMASDGNEIAHNLVALAGGDEPSALVAERRFLSLRTREICGLAIAGDRKSTRLNSSH